MTKSTNHPEPFPSMLRLRHAVASRFSLRDDKADDSAIDDRLRGGVELRGATPWVLMFAILIASIGLNVNSAAVVIGAMLISPLMGPIMGIGYGVGIYDFQLIRKSFLNLGLASGISLLTSALYFAISPLSQAQSELLARTTPTMWDVLIALFGGLAGIVGMTRKEKSNVIPGVAIATALMPPLCTAGYGLANGNWQFFAGAFYLFAINCIFIAFSAVVVISLLKLPHRKFVDVRVETRVRRVLYSVVIIAVLPSLYLASKLVKEEIFTSNARAFVTREFNSEKTHAADVKIFPEDRRLEVTLIGQPINDATLRTIESRLGDAGLAGASIAVHQSSDNRIDITSLKAGIVSDLYRDSLRVVATKEDEIKKLRLELEKARSLRAQSKDIALELNAQYPQISGVVIGDGIEPNPDAAKDDRRVFLLFASSQMPLAPADKTRIENWFQARTKSSATRIFIEENESVVVRPKRSVK